LAIKKLNKENSIVRYLGITVGSLIKIDEKTGEATIKLNNTPEVKKLLELMEIKYSLLKDFYIIGKIDINNEK